MKEARYTLTTHCIESGTLKLTPSLRAVLGDAERVPAVGPGGIELELIPDRELGVVRGLAPLFATGDFAANDLLRFFREGDRVTIELVGRRLRRTSEPPRPPEPKPKAKRKPAVTPYPAEVLYPSEAQKPAFVEALTALGLEAFPEGRHWRLRARMGRKVLTLVAGRAGTIGAEELVAARAERGADFALWVVDEARPTPRPGLVVASEEALFALRDLHRSFPLGGLDLARLLAAGRIGLDEVEAQRQAVAGLLGERAQFSAVVLALAAFRKDQVFLIEDVLPEVGEAVSPDGVQRVLEALAGPPFFVLERLAPGEYRLRESVPDFLDALAAYAQQLKRRLSVRV